MPYTVRSTFEVGPSGLPPLRTDTGQPFQVHRPGPVLRNGRLYTPAGSPGGFLTADMGPGGGDAISRMAVPLNDGGGQALYFRVANTNNWWRVVRRGFLDPYQVQVGTSDPVFGFVGDGTFYYKPAGGWVYTGFTQLSTADPNYNRFEAIYGNFDRRVNVYLTRYDYNGGKILHYTTRQVYENQTYQKISDGQPIYETRFTNRWQLILESCRNGGILTERTSFVSGDHSEVWVDAKDDIIRVGTSLNGGAEVFKIADPWLEKASRVGVGFGTPRDQATLSNSLGIDALTAVPHFPTPRQSRIVL